MGDGGFWHNGLITGVASNLFNKGDGVLIVMQNGYASATGQQYIPSSTASRDGTTPGMDIEKTLRSMGVKWLRKVRTYGVANMVKTLKEAMRTAERGLKVIIADGECQLARQRRVRAEDAVKLERGERVTRTRYGVDDEICTGDHSCIRLSGCPSLTVKPSPDPLRTDPVATVVESCVGCGLCGEVAHAAVLCPSFYRAEIVRNATAWDRTLFRLRQKVIGWLGGYDGEVSSMTAPRPITLLIAALGGEGGGVLTNWIVSGGGSRRLPGAEHVDPRRRATHRRHDLLHRDFAGEGRRARRQAPGAGAHARRRRHRHRGGERTARSRPHGGERFRHARPHHVIASLSRFYAMDEKIAMGDGRFDQDKLTNDHQSECARQPAHRHGCAGQAKRFDHQRGDARRHCRLRAAAADHRATRSGDPRRRQIDRQQSARLPRRLRCRARQAAAGHADRTEETRRADACSRSNKKSPRRSRRPRSRS